MSDIDPEIFNPTRHFLGWDAETGARVYVPLTSYLGRSAELIGAPGSGKTDELMKSCRTLTLSGSGYVYFDYANTGYDQAISWDAHVAELLLQGVEEPYADDVPEFVGITEAFIGRHAYATVGGLDPIIRINPYRRCRFPDGTRESVEDVVGRIERVFATQYAQYHDHVQFAKNLKMVTAILVAAEQRISDWPLLLTSADYRSFVRTRHEALGTAADPFVRRQCTLLDDLLALPPKERRDEIHSFTNRLEPFTSGALAAFFSDENLALEDVAYRGRRLFLSVAGLNSSEHRKFVMRIVWSMLDTLVARRRFRDQAPVGVEFIDEIGWLPPDFFDVLTRRRNNRWSSVTARQLIRQFEGPGFERAHETSAVSSATRILYGPPENVSEARELAARLHTIGRDDAWVERMVVTHSAAQSNGSSLGRKESVADVDTHTKTTGTSTSERFDGLGIKTGTTKGLTASDGITSGKHRTTGVDHGTSHVDTYGVSRTLTAHRLTYDEQLSYFAQALLQPPKHVATVITDEMKRRVLMERARQIPVMGIGEEIVENYLRLNTAIHRSRTVVVPRFDPSVRVAAPQLPAPTTRRLPRAPSAATPIETRGSADDVHDAPPAGSPEAQPGDTAVALPPFPISGAEPEGLLSVLATLRFATVQTVILLTSWSYDKAYRELETLRKAGLLDRFQPPVGREKGSAPSVYVLTGEGASRLAPQWPGGIEDLRRTVKNTGAKRRDVEEGNATNLHHALATTALFSLLVRRVRTVEPTAVIDAVYWDRGLSIPVDIGPWIAPLTPRERLLVSPDIAAGTTTITTYVPDVTFRVTWQPPGYRERITELMLVEVETGAGGKDYDQVGAVKGVKLAAVIAAAAETSRVGPIPVPNPRLVKALFWCGTASVEDGIRTGIRRVLTGPKRPVVTTNAGLLPLSPPSGTVKKDLPGALTTLAGRIGDTVWSWYAQGDTAPRFGYPRAPSSPSPRST